MVYIIGKCHSGLSTPKNVMGHLPKCDRRLFLGCDRLCLKHDRFVFSVTDSSLCVTNASLSVIASYPV